MKICVPIQCRSQEKAIEIWKSLKGKADLVEIWIDHIKDLELQNLLKEKFTPVVCVCKKPIEMGKFKGTYKQAFELLSTAAQLGSDYIDIPLSQINNFKLKNKNCKLIYSYHNFTNTPSSSILLKKVKEMKKSGANVIKIATKIKSLQDSTRLILLANKIQELKLPHIIIGMGEKGVITRVLTPTLGGEMMFAAYNKSKASAPGQLTIEELKKEWKEIKTI